MQRGSLIRSMGFNYAFASWCGGGKRASVWHLELKSQGGLGLVGGWVRYKEGVRGRGLPAPSPALLSTPGGRRFRQPKGANPFLPHCPPLRVPASHPWVPAGDRGAVQVGGAGFGELRPPREGARLQQGSRADCRAPLWSDFQKIPTIHIFPPCLDPLEKKIYPQMYY